MRLNKRIKLIAVGSIIGLANVSFSPIGHSYAEELTIPVNSAALQSLNIEEFQLDQEFSADVQNYTASVTNDIKSMNLLIETNEDSASVTVNGETMTSGEKSNLLLETGENLFTIIVTNGNDVSTYTITVVRAQNENNKLANLTLSSGEIEFDPEVTSYSINVNNETNKVTVAAVVVEDTSIVQVDETVINSDGYLVELPVGLTTISIIVTAENGSQRTYTVNVTRAEIEDEPEQNPETSTEPENEGTQQPATPEQPVRNTSPGTQTVSKGQYSSSMSQTTVNTGVLGVTETNTKANLDSLTVSIGTWNKSFASDVYTYHLDVATDVTSVTLSADAAESDAEITIDDKVISSTSEVNIDDKAKTVISVVVTHDEDRKTYILVFDKDINEETTVSTAENEVESEVSVDSQTVNARESGSSSQMDLAGEFNRESDSVWQRILSFFGL
ncbi:cadherin-like beta sandwich domain-containing protein [Robertmurraya sp. GLU-23]